MTAPRVHLQKGTVKKRIRPGGSQRDVVYLGRPIAPWYMSPNAGGGGEVAGSQPKKTKHLRISLYQRKDNWLCTLNSEVQVSEYGGFLPKCMRRKQKRMDGIANLTLDLRFLKIVKITNIAYEYSNIKNDFRYFKWIGLLRIYENN